MPSGTLSVGPFDDFKGMHVADLDGDGREDLLLAGTSRFGVVLTGQKGLEAQDPGQLRVAQDTRPASAT